MNFLGGGERHSSADYRRASSRSADSHKASPGLPQDLLGRPGDVRNFIHRSAIGRFVGGAISTVVRGVPLVGGVASGIFDTLRGAGGSTVPQAATCPPGFLSVGGQCVPRFTTASAQPTIPFVRRDPRITAGSVSGFSAQDGRFPPPTRTQREFRESLDMRGDPAAGVAVMGRFGAGFEPEVIMTDTRRCGRGAVLGVDGLCYNRRDLRNSDRFWPRGRRPLLTGGEVRAISVASSAAKKLERKQKQLMELGLLKRPTRSRRAVPAGHRATLKHDGGSDH